MFKGLLYCRFEQADYLDINKLVLRKFIKQALICNDNGENVDHEDPQLPGVWQQTRIPSELWASPQHHGSHAIVSPNPNNDVIDCIPTLARTPLDFIQIDPSSAGLVSPTS